MPGHLQPGQIYKPRSSTQRPHYRPQGHTGRKGPPPNRACPPMAQRHQGFGQQRQEELWPTVPNQQYRGAVIAKVPTCMGPIAGQHKSVFTATSQGNHKPGPQQLWALYWPTQHNIGLGQLTPTYSLTHMCHMQHTAWAANAKPTNTKAMLSPR